MLAQDNNANCTNEEESKLAKAEYYADGIILLQMLDVKWLAMLLCIITHKGFWHVDLPFFTPQSK